MSFLDEVIRLQRRRTLYLRFALENNPGVDWAGDPDRLFGKFDDARGPIPVKGTVTDFGTFSRSVTNHDFDFESPSVTIGLLDEDNEWRILAIPPSHRLLYRWIHLLARVADDTGLYFDERIAVGQITNPTFPSGKKVQLGTQLTGGAFLGEMIPRRLVTLNDFPRAAPEEVGKAVPIVYGVLSNRVLTGTDVVVPPTEPPDPDNPQNQRDYPLLTTYFHQTLAMASWSGTSFWRHVQVQVTPGNGLSIWDSELSRPTSPASLEFLGPSGFWPAANTGWWTVRIVGQGSTISGGAPNEDGQIQIYFGRDVSSLTLQHTQGGMRILDARESGYRSPTYSLEPLEYPAPYTHIGLVVQHAMDNVQWIDSTTPGATINDNFNGGGTLNSYGWTGGVINNPVGIVNTAGSGRGGGYGPQNTALPSLPATSMTRNVTSITMTEANGSVHPGLSTGAATINSFTVTFDWYRG